MNSSQFRRSEFKRLCAIIGINPNVVTTVASNLNDYYQEWVEKKKDSKGNFKKYKDGTIKTRTIRPSLLQLKEIQKNIKNKILSSISMPSCIHGGIKKRSNISNAKPHQGKKYIFTTDLQEFYPNIKSTKVYETFVSLKFSPHLSHWLTKLTTWKGELPQGTPTSTHVANLVFLPTDLKLIELCKANDITYTRYVDDLTFSSQFDFQDIIKNILELIQNDGFKLSRRKTKYQGKQTITGIDVFLNKIDAPTKIIELSKIEIETQSHLKPFTNYLNNIRFTNR